LNINQFQQNWQNPPELKGNRKTGSNDSANANHFAEDLKRSNARLQDNKDQSVRSQSSNTKDLTHKKRNEERLKNTDPGYAAVQTSQQTQVTVAAKETAPPQTAYDLSQESSPIQPSAAMTGVQSPSLSDSEKALHSGSALSGLGLDSSLAIGETGEASLSMGEESAQGLTSVKPSRPNFSQLASDSFTQNGLSVTDADAHSVISNNKNIFSQPISSQSAQAALSNNSSENLDKALQDLETELSTGNNDLLKQMELAPEQEAFSAKNQMNLSVDATSTQKLGANASQIGESSDLASELSATGLSALASLKGRDSSQEKGQQNFDGQQQDLQWLINGVQTDANLSSQDRFAVDMENSLNAPNKSSESQIDNMDSIVRQARSFIKDGGGSMEIHLQPEGLGKVQLKVDVHEGKVNVEMMTDNPAAKKALEEGLFDVKNALEGQKLIVDTLKVEMSQDYQRDFTDLKDHMQEQANRDFAQDFLEQFRQDRQSRFTGMIDRFRDFPQSTSDSELKLAQNNPYASRGKGQTLNLVA
jgi:flagellar hook-length control protein FliK